jgi:hypothetical protein
MAQERHGFVRLEIADGRAGKNPVCAMPAAARQARTAGEIGFDRSTARRG